MLAALVFFSAWLSGCGGGPGTDPISLEALADPTVNGTDDVVIEPRKPLRLDFSREDSFNNESGVLLMRGVHLRYLPEIGHLLPGAVGVLGRKEVWHGPMLRLPKLEAGQAYAVSVWVKPRDTTDSTRFSLVLTRVTDGTSARFELGEVLVEPDQWGKVEGEFIAVDHGGDQIQTLHLDVDSALTDYIIDDISVAYAEFSEELEAAAIEDVEQRVGRYVRNGDAEEGLEPWSHQGGLITRSSVQAHSGQHSILISGRTQGWNAPVMSVRGLEDQIRYKFSIFTRLQKGESPASMKMTMADSGCAERKSVLSTMPDHNLY